MSYPTIAVHLDGGARCDERTTVAIGLAARLGSRLIGVSPTGLPDVILSLNSAVRDQVELVALSAADLKQRADQAAGRFEQRCIAAGIGAFESRVVVDKAVDAVVRHGRCSDLVIVGQSDRIAPVAGVALDLPQQVLLQGGTPVLVVPHGGSFRSLVRCALVAWKERPEATRAIRDALPILRVADRVVLCALAEGEPDDVGAKRCEDVRVWLATHGVRAELRREARPPRVGERLLSLASDIGAELIVAGGYGHSRLREWALGGVTRHLLEHTILPTLLSH